MEPEYRDSRIPLFIGIGLLLVAILAELAAIIILNNGTPVYTLDDAYIHLALAENIITGHYGVNNHEYSAPASSILWPFIVAPFSSYEYFPLLLNVSAAITTLYLFVKILQASLGACDQRTHDIFVSSFLLALILATNLIGLIFTGMEHSLQVLIIAVIVYGLIIEIETNKLEPWLLIAIVVAPLIRYENLAVSLAAIGYLAMHGYFRHAASVMILLLVSVGGFSLFLTALGLAPFPTSVVTKSPVVGSGGGLGSMLLNLWGTLNHRQGVILALGGLAFLSYSLFAPDIKKGKLALIATVALLMHGIAGRYGGYNRYEIYIWSFFLLLALYLSGPRITKIIARNHRSAAAIKMAMITVGVGLVTGSNYLVGLFGVPLAANNIYEQHYQMHRFAADYYDKPVAVTDLGYVSYKNDNYVLDLWGLGSEKALAYRKNSGGTAAWMKELTDEKDTELAMIYEVLFRAVPDEWIKIGELQLGKRKVTPMGNKVAFYATNRHAYSGILEKLRLFIKTLPHNVEFTFDVELRRVRP